MRMPRQLLEVGLDPNVAVVADGLEWHVAGAHVLAPEQLTAQPAADGGKQIEDGIGAVLAGPLLHHEPRRRDQFGEELLAVAPVTTESPLEHRGHRDQPGEEGLHQHAPDEGVGPRLAQQHPDQPGRVLALAPARGPAHVLDQVEGGRAGGRVSRRAEDELGQAGVAPGHPGQRPDGAGGAADGLPFGGHVVDEVGVVSPSACGHGLTVARGAPPMAPPGQATRGALAISQLGGSVRPMDIDEFYEADPRRRSSAELELGTEWLDADGIRHELNYVEDTGELYVLREPAPHVTEDPFGGLFVKAPPGYEHKMTVHIIASIPTKDELHTDPRRVAGPHVRPGRPAVAGRPPARGRGGGRSAGRHHRGRRARPAGLTLGGVRSLALGQALQAGGSRSSMVARSWVARLFDRMSASAGRILLSSSRSESRSMTTAKRKPENTS